MKVLMISGSLRRKENTAVLPVGPVARQGNTNSIW